MLELICDAILGKIRMNNEEYIPLNFHPIKFSIVKETKIINNSTYIFCTCHHLIFSPPIQYSNLHETVGFSLRRTN